MDLLSLLFPREKKFYKMIEEQVALVGEGVAFFHKLITQFDKITPQKRKTLAAQVSHKEQEDDILYAGMVRALKSTFITPMDREDIHQLVVTFDTIIDTVELLALKIEAFKIKKMDKHFAKQTEIFNESYELTQKLILSIRSESQAEKICSDMRKLEQKADNVYIESVESLFSDSKDAVEIIKWKDLHATIEHMVDELTQACQVIENLVVKYS